MKIIGTKREIEWVLENLSNGCQDCLYMEACNTQSVQESETFGDSTENECRKFLSQAVDIECIEA